MARVVHLRKVNGQMATDLFAGVGVTDFERAVAWFESLLGEPAAFEATDTEHVWSVAEHGWIYVVLRPERAGQAMVTVFLDDLDRFVESAASRGIEPDQRETYENGVRKIIYFDPDGNEIGFGGGPDEGRTRARTTDRTRPSAGRTATRPPPEPPRRAVTKCSQTTPSRHRSAAGTGHGLWHSRLVHALAAVAAPTPDWRLAAVLAVLVVIAVATSYAGQLGVQRDLVTAAARAVVQLAAVSLVIAAALKSVWWSMAVVLVMYLVAVGTSARRMNLVPTQWPWVGTAIAAGVVPVLVLSLGSGVIPFNGAGIVPIAGIVIGGMMTASTLTGRRACDELTRQFGSYEAGLSLGMPQADAAFLVVQPAGREALTPGLDQTRTVGLVTLPGAFVGVLLGGGTAYEAAAAQILVLIGLMAGQAITTAVLLRLVAAGRVVRRDLLAIYPR